MNAYELLAWGERHNYPQLVLGERDVLRHGRARYYALVEGGDTQRLERAIARVEMWERRFAQEKAKVAQ